MANRKLISFDWAIKKILRSKVNFGILEGFLSVLLNTDIKILEILDSESNKDSAEDKSNRVDIKVRDTNGQIIIIEVQFTREYDYLNRMLYGTSKVVTEHISEGKTYKDVVKAISINIMFMSLGIGDDYVYHGKTSFVGIHTKSVLQLTDKEKIVLKAETIEDCYPEYFIIDVSNFNDLAKNSLDQWIYFLKNEEIKDEFDAPGLKAAKKVFDILKMDPVSRQQYENYIDFRRREISRYETGKIEGREEGLKQGLKQGLEQGLEQGREEERAIQEKLRADQLQQQKIKIVKLAKSEGLSVSLISKMTGFSKEEIEKF